ncbi:NAD(P)-binding domain [Phytophthora cactorum]|nr:NAD(P)-binding domain [Phytophthora cactorum]
MPSIAGTRVALIGAGAVNFGGAEGPWDHASRLEKLGAAQEKIDERRANKEFAHVWANTEVYADIQDMLDNVKPSAVFIGVPPSFHGCYKYPLELQVLRAGAHLFLEKPLSNAPVDEVTKYAAEVEALRKEKKLVVSVGYMFRYSLFGEKIKELLKGKKPVCLMARYNCTGALGNLVHGALLQGEAYDASVEIMADGLRIGVVKPYSETPTLKVLQGDSDEEVTFEFSGDDMYLTEDREFLKAVHGEGDDIRCQYQDAVNTYALTCKIRDVALAN